MYSGYKTISCKKEFLSLLNKLDALGYKWGSGNSLINNDSEIRQIENYYSYGKLALIFSDTKQVYYCGASSAPAIVNNS